MSKIVFTYVAIMLITAASLVVRAETDNSKLKRHPTQAGSSPQCDDVARNILANNAGQKIEDSSKAADFKLKSTANLGEASTSKVVSVYTEPSDNSSYLIEFYGEGCP